MYSTAKEVHIGIQSRLNQINSNRKRTFRPEEIDEVFNSVMLKFIEERSIIDATPKGLLESVKRYDDLQDLNVIDKEVDIVVLENGIGIPSRVSDIYCVLPADYYKFEELKLGIDWNCKRTDKDVTFKPQNSSTIATVEFTPDDIAQLNDVEVKIGTFSVFKSSIVGLTNLTNINSKFMVINAILEEGNVTSTTRPNFDVYWERYADMYYKNNFIFVMQGTQSPGIITITYGAISKASVIVSTLYKSFDDVTLNKEVPTDLVSSKYFKDIKSNYYMYKNRYKKPLIQMSKDTLKLDYNPQYLPILAYMTYIKKPVLLNLRADIMTDFTSHIEEIIDLTVTHLSLILSGDVQATATISTRNTQ